MAEENTSPQPGIGKDGIAPAALVVSIVSVVSIFGALVAWCFLPLAFLTAAAGIVLGYFGLGAPQKSKQARIALIISGVSLFLQICYIVLMLVVFGGTYIILNDPAFWEELMRGF